MELKKEHYIEFLGECFYIISQHCYSATWMNKIEYKIWDMLQEYKDGQHRFKYGGCTINTPLLEILQELSKSIDGWVMWDDKKSSAVYIELSKWIPLYEKWKIEESEFKKQIKEMLDREERK